MGSNQEAKGSCPDPELTNDLRKLCRPVLPPSLPPSPSCSLPLSATHGSYGYFSKITLCPFLPLTQPERSRVKTRILPEKKGLELHHQMVLTAWGAGGGGGGVLLGTFQPDHRASLRVGTLGLLPSCPHHKTADDGVGLLLPCLLLNRFSHLILTVTLPTESSLLQTSLIRELHFLQGCPTNKQEDCAVSSDLMLSL